MGIKHQSCRIIAQNIVISTGGAVLLMCNERTLRPFIHTSLAWALLKKISERILFFKLDGQQMLGVGYMSAVSLYSTVVVSGTSIKL